MALTHRTPARRRKLTQGAAKKRQSRFFEQLEERTVMAVTWGVQSDFFGTQDVISQPRSLRGLALSSDDQHLYAGFINGSSTSAIREVSSGINTGLIGNGVPGPTYGANSAYSAGVEASLSTTSQQPRGLATDDRGNVYSTLSSGSNSLTQIWGVFPSNLSAPLSSKSSTNNIATSQISGMATAKLGGNYYTYVGWKNGLIERWNVNDPANPTLDTSWGAAGTPGKISLKSITANAYLNNLEIDTDGTIFVAGGLLGTTSFGDALIKIPAAAAASGNLATATSVAVSGGANDTAGVYGAMDVALYAGKAYVTQYLQTNSTISSFYTLDLTSAGKITPNITTLAGPSGKVSTYNNGTDSGFSGIEISSDGKIYLAEQVYSMVAAASSYTPPGGAAMTGTRILFDRVLVSSALDVAGPVTSAVVATPNPIVAGALNSVTVTATISDATTNASPIASAEYRVNGGDWLPMAAVDGVFDEVPEDVTATFTLGAAGITVPGNYSIDVRGKDSANQIGASASVTLEVLGSAPDITSDNSATFTVGSFSTFNVTVDGVPTPELDITGQLPSGVSFVDNGNGTATLSGTPDVGEGGVYTFTIMASNGILPMDSQEFTLTVNEAPTFASANATTFTVAVLGSFTITTNDFYPSPATITYTGSLPNGVSLVDNGDGTATLSGTPAGGTQGSYEIALTASNGVAPNGTQSFTLTVNPPPIDYGDAPDTYGTLLASNGARHGLQGPTLGATRDAEANGQPNLTATGDGADEDGVVLPANLYARLGAKITVTASAAGRLDAWIDFNRNGVFDASEKIADGVNVVTGSNTLAINVPTNTVAGASYARFRLSSTGGLSPTGAAADGEVEDYAVNLVSPALGSIAVIDDPENPGHGLLVVRGTNYFYETITVAPTAGQPGKVTASISPGVSVPGIDLASFDRIAIFGEAGFDQITINSAITKPSVIYGDAGFDTINGGGGNDVIYGGADYDSLNGNGGDDTFVNEGGADSVNGGAGTDTIIKIGSGTFNLSNGSVSDGSGSASLSSIEKARLIGGAAADTFNVAGWSGISAEIEGGGGANLIADSADGNFVLQPNQLVRTVGSTTTTIQFTNIQTARLTGGFGNNNFDLSGWTQAAILDGGYFGTDSVTVAGDVSYLLSDTMLLRPSFGQIRLAGFENAVLNGGASNNSFDLINWKSAATVNGLGGTDKIIAAGNVNFTLTNTTLTRSTGGAIALASIEQAELSGGAGANTINASGFSGNVKLDGADGNDTLTAGSGLAILLGGAGNDILNAGTGRAVMIGGLGVDTLNGGSNDDLLVDGTTVHDSSSAALALILAEWASASSYNDRVAHLTGTPGGVNGSTHLGGSNVIHDTAVDSLFGNAGDDLFFAKLTAPNQDNVTKTSGETAQ
ncbi:beta strand repeat-containing protein [Anatilimnocola floriformis]|uniref:beta strand repeat-containing protein n=1 Tax=Anatilimnocola floriformis TaxID=2948575 RepID=UPI0020C3DF24|nr:GEVED domain-containing protein [Anatilimnocola floriformis]